MEMSMPARALTLEKGRSTESPDLRVIPQSFSRDRDGPSHDGPAPLVREARRGSRRAFDALWERYAPTVRGILLTMVGDDEAEDLTQDVAVRAFSSLSSLKKPASFPAWICAIARNMGRDARRAGVAPQDAAGAARTGGVPGSARWGRPDGG
jgi:hypothetical protein